MDRRESVYLPAGAGRKSRDHPLFGGGAYFESDEKGYITGKGYIVSPASYVVVVGGVNMDIGGISHAQLVSADSNPAGCA